MTPNTTLYSKAAAILLFAAWICPAKTVAAPPPAREAAAGESKSDGAQRPQSLRIVPQDLRLSGAGASQRFLVLAMDLRGLERDVTFQSSLRVSDPRLVRIGNNGRLVAVADGQIVLEAQWQGRSAQANVSIKQSTVERPVNFARDIVGVLTKRGCNASHCHGGVKGRGGFKLSLHGLDPQEDYRWIVQGGTYQVLVPEPKEPILPRINVQQPTASLLLRKPSLAVKHGGGERLKVGSSDYAMVMDWIRRGARYPEDTATHGPTIERLEVFPRLAVIDRQGAHRILVTAQISTGQQEDLSEKVRYESSNPEVLEVNAEGLVKGVKPGEAVVFVHAPGHTASARFGVIDAPTSSYPQLATKNLIDEHVFVKLQRLRIVPSELASDHELLRRVCLDLTGTLPPPQRVREFLASKDRRKRDELIEILLDSPEYVDYWTFRFSDFFRVTWRNVSSYQAWIRSSIAYNKPFDQMAREHVAAQGNTGPTRNYFKPNGGLLYPKEKMAGDLRLFLGVRFECAECHNHPFETWSQDQFWGLAAFYGRTTRVQKFGLFFEYPGGHGENPEGPRVMHPRRGKEVEPRFLDGTLLSKDEAEPRMRLVEWMTAAGNPYFARAIVNRIWAHFFSRGIVDPVDDFRDTNPPTHPDLLDALAQDFEESGYDLKHLMRLITQSRTYQLSGTSNETNKDDTINYSRALPRRLDAEILLDAVTHVTGVEEVFAIHQYARGGVEPARTRAIELVAEVSPSQFLDVFGRPPFRESVPLRDRRVTLGQALHTLVGSAFNEKIGKEGGRVDRLLKDGASNREVIADVYLAALSRFPTSEELAELEKLVEQASSPRKAIENLVWALIASREFTYNH